MGYFVMVCIALLLIDPIVYGLAKCSERNEWYYKLPFMGFVALLKFGRDAK